jgi:sugar fermentation stimulation protein A
MLRSMQYPYKPPFETILTAEFLHRPNRFIVHCRLESGEEIRAFLPNPGRLKELLLPAVTVYVVPVPPESERKTRFTMVGVAGEHAPIFLHTHVNNDVARHLLEHDLVPGLEGASIVRAEVPLGRSRFDFLLEHDGEPVYVEVKSCTLFGNGVAMFPDAITERGRRHLEELAALSDRGTRCVVIFVVHSGEVLWFMPDYHTDLAFAKTLLAVRDRVTILPMAVAWTDSFVIERPPRLLPIPWEHVEREAEDRGAYILVGRVEPGAAMPSGFYLVVGWCEDGLAAFLRSATQSGRRLSPVVRALIAQASATEALPIVASEDCRESLLAAIDGLEGAEGVPEEIASTDGGGSIRYFASDPMSHRTFHDLLARFRMAHPAVPN